MRSIVNISLPLTLVREVKKEVKAKGYGSTSEFFRDLLRAWREDQIIAELHQSRKEIAAGKGKVLRSLKDLR